MHALVWTRQHGMLAINAQRRHRWRRHPFPRPACSSVSNGPRPDGDCTPILCRHHVNPDMLSDFPSYGAPHPTVCRRPRRPSLSSPTRRSRSRQDLTTLALRTSRSSNRVSALSSKSSSWCDYPIHPLPVAFGPPWRFPSRLVVTHFRSGKRGT
mgnify:CR=1 FL=1